MMLTNENYFSQESNKKYMSASQFKTFMDCESRALAEINGEYAREKTTALLVGSYVDAHFEKTLDLFKAQNPEIFLKSGGLKAEFKHAEYIIERIERDPFFMKYMNGGVQKIMTGEIEGVPFKIKIDVYHPEKAIVDLKIMRDLKKQWKDRVELNFIEFWGYDTSAAIYQAVEGNGLPFFIAAATKEDEPDLAIIDIPQNKLDFCLKIVKENAPRFSDIKNGTEQPTRCNSCNWCRKTKVLSEVIPFEEI